MLTAVTALVSAAAVMAYVVSRKKQGCRKGEALLEQRHTTFGVGLFMWNCCCAIGAYCICLEFFLLLLYVRYCAAALLPCIT